MFDFESGGLPQIYKRNAKECYLDPIRKKLIYITPEETVRQKVSYYLQEELHVPAEQLIIEQHLSHYGIESKKRADIVIHAYENEEQIVPIAVIECKAPEVPLDLKARDQMLEYCDLLGADYAMLTNGWNTYCFHYDNDQNRYVDIEELPKYEDMLKGRYKEVELGELPPRILFDNLQKYLENFFAELDSNDYGDDISKLTPLNIAVPIFNLWEGLLDTRVKMPTGNYGLFELIEDYGVRMLTYGNASGGKFYGPYRSFVVRIGENTEIFSVAVSTYSTYAKPDLVKTCISVAHDDEREAHHALQLVVDDNVLAEGNKIRFFHHGKIAIGNIGSGKVDELRMFVESRYPKLISGNKFYLGSLTNDRLWQLDDPEVIEVIVNMISYAIVRDEYREFVKKNKKK